MKKRKICSTLLSALLCCLLIMPGILPPQQWSELTPTIEDGYPSQPLGEFPPINDVF